jgi:hypothetical protein
VDPATGAFAAGAAAVAGPLAVVVAAGVGWLLAAVVLSVSDIAPVVVVIDVDIVCADEASRVDEAKKKRLCSASFRLCGSLCDVVG